MYLCDVTTTAASCVSIFRSIIVLVANQSQSIIYLCCFFSHCLNMHYLTMTNELSVKNVAV